MKNWWYNILFFFASILISGCVEPYEPAILFGDHRYLVVEGFLNNGAPSVIKLSRTTGFANADGGGIEPLYATVSVESKGGNIHHFENTQGVYVLEHIDLNPQDQYRLRIQTNDGQEYLSEYVTVKESPPIDSVSWVYEGDGLHIFANTHDPLDNTRYYRWEYEETWEFISPIESHVEYLDGEFQTRTNKLPTQCWQSENSTRIILGSSAKLAKDIIYLQPLTFIPRESWKMGKKYSILVKQYALSRDAYEYFMQMKKNNEQLGSLFDPQPVELSSNIYNVTSPNEPVVGYFSVGVVQEKRIYIDANQLKNWGYYLKCDVLEVSLDSAEYYFASGRLTPITINTMMNTAYGARPLCSDCSMIAQPVKPDFWE